MTNTACPHYSEGMGKLKRCTVSASRMVPEKGLLYQGRIRPVPGLSCPQLEDGQQKAVGHRVEQADRVEIELL